MDIIANLGVDLTIFFQFVSFLVGYFFLYFLVFKPYMKAYEERERRTEGTEEVAERLLTDTKDLQTEYQVKAQQLNAQYKSLYDKSRTEALKAHDQMVSEARANALQLLEKTRDQLNGEVGKAQEQIDKMTPEVAKEIASKLLGKELGA